MKILTVILLSLSFSAFASSHYTCKSEFASTDFPAAEVHFGENVEVALGNNAVENLFKISYGMTSTTDLPVDARKMTITVKLNYFDEEMGQVEKLAEMVLVGKYGSELKAGVLIGKYNSFLWTVCNLKERF